LDGISHEIDFLNGLIAKKGEEKEIPTPLNQEMYKRVKEITENKELSKEHFNMKLK
jgi:ketopantoate reductase